MRILSYQWDEIPTKDKPKLHIFYRLHDKKYDTNWKCVSKVECMNNFADIFGKDIILIADNCQAPDEIKKLDCKKAHITNLGNANSFIYQLNEALKLSDDDIVYFIEDDYLHKPGSKEVLLEGLEIADFVSLYDNPDKYMKNGPNPLIDGGENSKVFLTKSSHWRTTNSTTMSFATRVKNLKKYHSYLIEACRTEQPKDFEMWQKILQDSTLVIPIPGYATHCHEPWITPFLSKDVSRNKKT